MIDFRCIGLYEVRIFSVSENGENVLGDEGADEAMHPEFLGYRTAPAAAAAAPDAGDDDDC